MKDDFEWVVNNAVFDRKIVMLVLDEYLEKYEMTFEVKEFLKILLSAYYKTENNILKI